MDKNYAKKTIEVYQRLYDEHGYSIKTLGWDKGKQFLRFHQLTSDWDLEGARILDVGCGFGDFVGYMNKLGIRSFSYVGIDFVESFVLEGRKRYGNKDVEFTSGDFLSMDIGKEFDFVISSGIFNLKVEGVDGYTRIEDTLSKMFSLSSQAIAADFLSDRLDYLDNNGHFSNFTSSPERILSIAYSMSRNIALKNNYFPFEFAVNIYKDDSFSKETTAFRKVENMFGKSGGILL
jgi:SAM-dependent methyltransferase